MRYLFLVLFLFSAMLLGADRFLCPMHCEGKKTYEQPGTCPVCHMYLEKEPEPGAETGPLSSKDYRVDISSKVLVAKPVLETEITITPRKTENNSVLSDLEKSNGVEMEVYVTNQALNEMYYFVPKKNQDGSFTFTHKFYETHNALLFAVFKPKGVKEQTFPLALKVEVEKLQPKPKAAKQNENTSGFGYVIMVSEDTTYFVREHVPVSKIKTLKSLKKPRIEKAPKPGNYTLFFQFGNAPGPLEHRVLLQK